MPVAEQKLIAGGEEDFLAVNYLRLRGSHSDIGHYLAQYARDNLGASRSEWADPMITRAQRRYMKQNWPENYARMQGAAEAFGLDLQDDRFDHSMLPYDCGLPGCSVVFYPSELTSRGRPVVSRNFDFSTGYMEALFEAGGFEHASMAAAGGRVSTAPVCSRPLLLDVAGDSGYPTLMMVQYDILAVATDGINSEGLCASLMLDNSPIQPGLYEPNPSNVVGVSEAQVPRFVLERCATAAEARELLLGSKLPYVFSPTHYLIADASGDAFVWEYSPLRNVPRITDWSGPPLVSTNHLIYQGADFPVTPQIQESVDRRCRLQEAIDEEVAPYSDEAIRRANAEVQAVMPAGEGQYVTQTPARTIWYAFYDLEERSLTIDFYLGDEEGGRIRRSQPQTFRLG